MVLAGTLDSSGAAPSVSAGPAGPDASIAPHRASRGSYGRDHGLAVVAASAAPSPPPSPTLTVIARGKGSVRSEPGGIDCATATCSKQFEAGTDVVLRAEPDDVRSTTGRWTGCKSGNDLSCTVSMVETKTVEIEFISVPRLQIHPAFNLTIKVTPAEAGKPLPSTCPPSCDHRYGKATEVRLLAQGDDAVIWTGDRCDHRGDEHMCYVKVDGATTVNAAFTPWGGIQRLPRRAWSMVAAGFPRYPWALVLLGALVVGPFAVWRGSLSAEQREAVREQFRQALNTLGGGLDARRTPASGRDATQDTSAAEATPVAKAPEPVDDKVQRIQEDEADGRSAADPSSPDSADAGRAMPLGRALDGLRDRVEGVEQRIVDVTSQAEDLRRGLSELTEMLRALQSSSARVEDVLSDMDPRQLEAKLADVTTAVDAVRDSVTTLQERSARRQETTAEALVQRLTALETELQQLRADTAATDLAGDGVRTRDQAATGNVLNRLATLTRQVARLESREPAPRATLPPPPTGAGTETLAPRIIQWLSDYAPTPPDTHASDQQAYLAALRRCIRSLRSEPDAIYRDVDIGIVHLEPLDPGQFLVHPVMVSWVENAALDCPSCPSGPEAMAYHHLGSIGGADDDGLLLFMPPGALALPQSFALGFRMLIEALPSSPRIRIQTIERPAFLGRARIVGAHVYVVTTKMRLVADPEPDA